MCRGGGGKAELEFKHRSGQSSGGYNQNTRTKRDNHKPESRHQQPGNKSKGKSKARVQRVYQTRLRSQEAHQNRPESVLLASLKAAATGGTKWVVPHPEANQEAR